MKDYLILLLFIIIVYLLFNNPDHFTNDIITLDDNIKSKIKEKCDIITSNINNILKATNDSVTNMNDLKIKKNDITVNNMTVNNNATIQKSLNVMNNVTIPIKYTADNEPITNLNIFPDYMIVAYNIEELDDTEHLVKTYKLPPGWVKCDGSEYYVFTKDNHTIAVSKNYSIKSGKYDDTRNINIQTEFKQNNQNINPIKKIVVPNLQGRFIYGAANDSNNPIYKDNTIQTNIGGQEYVQLTVDQMAHNHLTHIGLESNTAPVVYGKNTYPTGINTTIPSGTSTDFLSFDFQNIPKTSTDPYVISTSDFFNAGSGYKINNNNITFPGNKTSFSVPHKNMPPYYTLIYIMKIASVVIQPPP